MRRTVRLVPILATVLGALAGPGAAGALAQDGAPAIAGGITVIGYGQAAAPAETATLQLVATEEEAGPPRAPDPDATPGAAEWEAVAPIVDGLVAAGVAEADIAVVVSAAIGEFYGPGGPGVARIDVAVARPTVERLTALIDAAIVAGAEENLLLGLIGVAYEVADCRPLERRARAAALEDARARAAIQAELLGVGLGAPVATRDVAVAPAAALSAYYGPYAPTEAGCAPPLPDIATGLPITAPPFDPTREAAVEAYAQIEVRFAVAGA